MKQEVILTEDRGYDYEQIKSLLASVRDFSQNDLKIIVPEYSSKEKEQSNKKNEDENIMKLFLILQEKEPIYAECDSIADVDRIFNDFEENLDILLENLDKLLDKNKDLDEESKESLISYSAAIEKCINVYPHRKNRYRKKIQELNSVSEVKSELQHFLGEIMIGQYIIILIDGLYERVKNSTSMIYPLVVKEINQFLALNGVYTRVISEGDMIETEDTTPTDDFSNNITDDFEKYNTIAEVHRYPYYFKDGAKIVDGSAKIWRRKD